MSLPPPPPPPPPDLPGTSFLDRAGPIIARERGLSPRATVLLQSLAADMGLSDEEFAQAMEVLQSGEAHCSKATDPQRSRFRGLLRRQLKELTAKILSARHEQTLVSFAVTQMGIADEAAREDLHTVAGELGMRRVPLEESLRFVEQAIHQKIGEDFAVDSQDVRRLHVLGRDWGLEAVDVDELIRYRLEENSAKLRREKLWNTGVIAGTITVVSLVVLVLAILGIRGVIGTSEPTIEETNVGTPDEDSPVVSRKPPAWWDTDLTIAVGQVRSSEDFAPVYEAIIADDAQRRAQGYELLVERAARSPFDYRMWKPIEPILIGSYALDPEDAAMARLRAAWIKIPERTIENVPPTADHYQAAIRPVNSLVRALKDDRLPAERKRALVDDMSRLLRTSINIELPEPDLQRECLAALAEILLEQLAEAVEERPEVLSRHYQTLSALARDRVPPEEQARLDANIAAAAIEHAPDNWRSWEPILKRGIESRDALAVLRIVDAYGRTANAELRKILTPLLFDRVGISPRGIATDRYADALRKALGASLPADATDASRWARLEEQVAVLQGSRSAPSDEIATLRATVEIAWNVNLALALGGPRPSNAHFDQWLQEGPFDSKEEEATDPPSSSGIATVTRLSRDQQETLDRYIREIANWDRLDEGRRASYLRGIAASAEQAGDLNPQQARQLASYLLGRKLDEEHSRVMDAVTSIRHWKQLRLALADGVEKSDLTADQLWRLVVAMSGRDVAELDSNRSQARRALLESVASELGTGADKNESASELDRLANRLIALYRDRAELLGASAAETAAATEAAASLRMFIARLPADGEDSASRILELAESSVQSDVQRCVLLQQAALERSLQDIVRRSSDRKVEAQKIVASFRQQNAAARSALEQLRYGEQALLELWMLRTT